MAIESKAEYEAIAALVNSAGWAILKRELEEAMISRLVDAKSTKNKDERYDKIGEYNTIEFCTQLPYIYLNQYKGEFNK
jgi:hypothetical protein